MKTIKFEYGRKECWNELTKNVRVRLDGKYVIDADTYHGVKSMLLSTLPEKECCKFCLEKIPNHTYDCPRNKRNLKPSPVEEIDQSVNYSYDELGEKLNEVIRTVNRLIKK